MGLLKQPSELMRFWVIITPRDIRVHMFHSMDYLLNGDMWFRPRYCPDRNPMRLFHYTRFKNE